MARTWSLDDADRRLVWVNFWATACEPCRTEMPAMQRLAEEYGDDLLILGVDWGEDPAAVALFVERYGVSYPILLDPDLQTYYRWARTDGLRATTSSAPRARSYARSSDRWIRRAWWASSRRAPGRGLAPRLNPSELPEHAKGRAPLPPLVNRSAGGVSRRRSSRSCRGGRRTGSRTSLHRAPGRRSGWSRRDR